MTSHNNSLLKDLDALLVKVSSDKKAQIKKASPGDGADDGTSKPETGEQMAKNKEEAGKHTAAKVDGGAKSNPVGGSVDNSTEGATAVATSGQKGTEGADLAVKHQAANGPEGGIKSDDKKTASTKDLAEALRKAASSLDAAVEKNASAKESEVSGDEKSTKSTLSSLDYFLIKCARALPQVKSAAEGGMGDGQMAGHATDQLLQALQSGEIGEEDAEKMLMEMAQQGAISQDDLMQAMQAMHQDAGAQGAGGQPAPGGDPAAAAGGAGAPPADPAAGGAGAPPAAGAGMMQDPGLEAKMAAANVGPEHPQYVQKLASLYADDLDAGYALFLKIAESLVGDDQGDDHGDQKPEDKGVPSDAGKPVDAAPSDPAAHGGDPMSNPDSVLSPQDPAEQQALLKLLADMGLTPEDLQALAAHKAQSQQAAPAPAGVPGMDPKMAAFRKRAMVAILTKTAEIHLAALAKTSDKK